jgi:hypothetical protein
LPKISTCTHDAEHTIGYTFNQSEVQDTAVRDTNAVLSIATAGRRTLQHLHISMAHPGVIQSDNHNAVSPDFAGLFPADPSQFTDTPCGL